MAVGEVNRRAALATLCGNTLSQSQVVTRYDSKDFGNKFAEMDRQRRLKDSLEAFRDSLSVYKNIYGNEHPIVLAIMRSMANVYRDLGTFKTAKAIFENIMDTYRDLHIGPTVEFADTLFAYAVMLRTADEQDESITLLEQSTSIYRRLFGEESLATTVSMFVLASAHFESDSTEEATKLLDDCLLSFRKLYGISETGGKAIVEPPVIGDLLNYLGSAMQSKGNFEMAKAAYAEALDIFIVLYGDMHPSVAKTMNNLATLLDDSGSPDEASQLYDCSLSMLNHYFKSAHPLILITMENYSTMLAAKNNHVDSESLDLQADEIRAALFAIDQDIPEVEEELARKHDWENAIRFLKSFCPLL